MLSNEQALKASLQHPSSAEDPQLRREYLKLFTLASKAADVRHAASCQTISECQAMLRSIHCHCLLQLVRLHIVLYDATMNSVMSAHFLQMFTAREKLQLDVYGIWSVTRNQLHTDDSFTFNRTIKSIKDSILHLPDANEEEEEALQTIKVKTASVAICAWAHCDVNSLHQQ